MCSQQIKSTQVKGIQTMHGCFRHMAHGRHWSVEYRQVGTCEEAVN